MLTRYHYQPFHRFEPTWRYRVRPSTYLIGLALWVALTGAVVTIGEWVATLS